MQQDTLHIKHITMPDGSTITDQWWTVSGLDDIEAIYELDNRQLTTSDNGVMGQDDVNAIMSTAPTHFLVMKGNFTGIIRVEEGPSVSLVFENNQLVNIK